MNKVLEYLITAKDKTADAVNSALGRVKSFASGVLGQMANIKAGLEMAWGVAQKFAGIFSAAIKEAFKFEKAQSDFATLLNSIDAAKQHIADLRQFASSTPLTFDDLSKASKLLLSFGASVEDVMPSMKMLGDIAMGDSQKFQGLALVFAQVKSAGKLMGQDLLQMINQGFNPLTVIAKETGKSVSELKDIMSEGGITFEMVAEAMRVATSEGGLFNDAMANASQTGEGLMSTLQDKWTDVVRTFGEAFTDTAKGGVRDLIDMLTQLVESGDVEVWANDIANALSSIVDVAKSCASAIGSVVSAYKAVQNFGERIGAAVGGIFGAITNSGYVEDGMKEYEQTKAEQALDKQEEQQIREEAKARATLASSAVTEQNVEQKAKEAQTLAQMMAKAEETERLKVEKNIAKERNALMKDSVSQYSKLASELQKKFSEADSRLSSANSRVNQLLGFYEDPESYKAYLEQKQKQKAALEAMWADQDRLAAMNSSRLGSDKGFVGVELAQEMNDALNEQRAAQEYYNQVKQDMTAVIEQLEHLNGQLENGRGE